MARLPTKSEIGKAQAQTQRSVMRKQDEHNKANKDPFTLDPDGHGPGVMPEDVWQKHKKGGELNNG